MGFFDALNTAGRVIYAVGRSTLSFAKTIVTNPIRSVQVVAALALVTFKTTNGGGQSKFGVENQEIHLRDELGVNLPAEFFAAYLYTAVAITLITSVLTRGGNTCRAVLGRYYLYDLGILHDPVLDERRRLRAERAQNVEEEVPLDPSLDPGKIQMAIHVLFDSLFETISLVSSIIAIMPTFNFGKHFMEFAEHDQFNNPNISDKVYEEILWGAICMTVGNTFSNLNFNSKKARHNIFLNAGWWTNLMYDDKRRVYFRYQYDHWADIKEYWKAIALMIPNCFISEPANALFSTEKAMRELPFIANHMSDTGINITAVGSSGAVIVQQIFTAPAAVQQAWKPHPEVAASYDRLSPASKALYQFGWYCGLEDSIVTVLSYHVSIVNTIHKWKPSIALSNPWSNVGAFGCATIKGISNQAFSVNGALLDLLEDINPVIFEEEREKVEALRYAMLNPEAKTHANEEQKREEKEGYEADHDEKEANEDRHELAIPIDATVAAEINAVIGSLAQKKSTQPKRGKSRESKEHKNDEVVIEMPSKSKSKTDEKKTHKNGKTELHERLLYGEEDSVTNDSEFSSYQPPSFHKPRLMSAKSSPNLQKDTKTQSPSLSSTASINSKFGSPFRKSSQPSESKGHESKTRSPATHYVPATTVAMPGLSLADEKTHPWQPDDRKVTERQSEPLRQHAPESSAVYGNADHYRSNVHSSHRVTHFKEKKTKTQNLRPMQVRAVTAQKARDDANYSYNKFDM